LLQNVRNSTIVFSTHQTSLQYVP